MSAFLVQISLRRPYAERNAINLQHHNRRKMDFKFVNKDIC